MDNEYGYVNNLVDKLLACACMSSSASRQAVIEKLPADIQNTIMIAPAAAGKQQVISIVRTCLNFTNGLEALVAAVNEFEKTSTAFKDLQSFLGK